MDDFTKATKCYEKSLRNKAAFYSYQIAEIAEGHKGETILSDLDICFLEAYLDIVKDCKASLKKAGLKD